MAMEQTGRQKGMPDGKRQMQVGSAQVLDEVGDNIYQIHRSVFNAQ
jgi:hypothetical protein